VARAPSRVVTLTIGISWLAVFYSCLLLVVLSQTEGRLDGAIACADSSRRRSLLAVFLETPYSPRTQLYLRGGRRLSIMRTAFIMRKGLAASTMTEPREVVR
jgi:hypothetical protein